jgi:hypothetical protein
MVLTDPFVGVVEFGQQLHRLLQQGLTASGSVLGVLLLVRRVKQEPPGAERTFVTYHASIGYALPDESRLRERMQQGEDVRRSIPVDVSINEPICADRRVPIDGASTLRVSTPEDIVAEKLRALLQQKVRNRQRPQDLLDIAVLLKAGVSLDLS